MTFVYVELSSIRCGMAVTVEEVCCVFFMAECIIYLRVFIEWDVSSSASR